MARQIRDEILGVCSVLAALYLLLSLYSHDIWDPSFFTYSTRAPGNYGGPIGAYVSDLMLSVFGISAFVIPIALAAYGIRRIMGLDRMGTNLAGTALLLVSGSLLAGLITLSFTIEHDLGGIFGRVVGRQLMLMISVAGAYILGLALLSSSAILLSPVSIFQLISPGHRSHEADEDSPEGAEGAGKPGDAEVQPPGPDDGPAYLDDLPGEAPVGAAPDMPEEDGVRRRPVIVDSPGRTRQPPQVDIPSSPNEAMSGISTGASVLDELMGPDAPMVHGEDEAMEEMRILGPLVIEPPFEDAPVGERELALGDVEPPIATRSDSYRIPPLELLSQYERVERTSKESIFESSRLLEQKLLDYSVKGKITQVYTGPVVTMYEFQPAPGVKINRVVSLSEDLALALRAPSIRIAPVPGKAALGIEVPNKNREIVALREVFASESFTKSESLLTLALGKDIFGTPVTADLARMPHLLVAGATGSGKSVALNTMILSLLYRAKPHQLKMLMIDPKLLELSIYDGIPHLIAPVVTNPKEASAMLKKMVFEMERRYRLIAEQGVRNIDSYNSVVPKSERIPYLVIFIDELADLMLSSQAQVEDSIARLAQMARASGIHLVLATQRPSVDVITGVIKANFPARVAFQVTTKIDSRTIIDSQGAESLIGRGDMLFMLPGVKLLRVHGAYVSEHEVKDIVGYCAAQGEPDYSIVQMIEEQEQEAQAEAQADNDRDEMYHKAIEHAASLGEVSISSIQRKLKVGYNRAARIMALMEEDGMVGPPKAAGKPRDFIGPGRSY